jgi:hypothetical protein
MPNNDFRVRRFGDGDKVYGKDLEGLRDGVRATPIGRTFRGRTVRTPAGQIFMPYATPATPTQIEGGIGYRITIDSGSGSNYYVTVHTGFPSNDVVETQFEGELELSYAVANDLTAGTSLMATCFLAEGITPPYYFCYVLEQIVYLG